MELLFIRHAESHGNLQGIMQGRKDYALSEHGHYQADVLAAFLSHAVFDSQPPDFLYCSPLQRARQTAEPFQQRFPQLGWSEHPDLLEVDSGIFSGLTWAEARASHPEICERFKAARDWGAVPEGESKQQLWQRAERLLNDLQQRHSPGQKIVLLTHGGLIRAALSVLMGIAPDAELFLCIDNTSLSLAGIEGSRRYVRYINNTRHLNPCDFKPDYIPR